MIGLYDITVEYREKPLGLDVHNPRFSWKLKSDLNNTEQESYSIKVMKETEIVWETGIMKSSETNLIEYDGKPLEPETRYDVIIVSTDNYGNTASGNTCFETGIFGKFSHGWITHKFLADEEACPVFTRKFSLNESVSKARLYITALGVYDAFINGTRVSDTYLAPGWTSYNKRLQYQTYDVTDMIRGQNEISVTLANGWYKGNLAFRGKKNVFGDRLALLMELHVTYEDGSTETIGSDNDFMCCSGSVRYSEIYHGETQDLTYIPDDIHKADKYEHPVDMIVYTENEPVRIIERIDAVSLIETPDGDKVIDFGQNLAGFVEFECNLQKGTKVTIRHAEVLDAKGNFYTENLRTAKCTDTFICRGKKEILRPRFTFHGFRYISVEGIEEIDISKFRACVLHSDMKKTGDFKCSDELINKLQKNIQWGQKGNFIDIPTDCPQRDERLGWTGDAQVFCGTAAYNFNTALFFSKWLKDVAADQGKNGSVPNVVPDVFAEEGKEPGNSAAWGDAATIIPWEMFRRYGDKTFLENQYVSMKSWVEYIAREAGNTFLWTTGKHFGDWLALDMEQYFTNRKFSVNTATGSTDMNYIASAFFARSAEILYKTAEILDNRNDAAKYKKLYENVVNAFREEYVTAGGRLVCETQTGMLLALKFGLIEEKHRKALAERLVRNIKKHNNQMVTGFVGVSYLCPVLSENGYHDIAGKLLMQKEYPSWLYPVTKGATTIWERWNGIKPDGSFENPEMNSFNHYAYGAIGDWIYKYILGIRALEPGYTDILIKPEPIEGIKYAEGHYDSIHGRIYVKWAMEGGEISIDTIIPVNCKARIVIPGGSNEITVGSGEYSFSEKLKEGIY